MDFDFVARLAQINQRFETPIEFARSEDERHHLHEQRRTEIDDLLMEFNRRGGHSFTGSPMTARCLKCGLMPAEAQETCSGMTGPITST